LKRLVFKIQDIDIVVSKEFWEYFDAEDIKYIIEVADHRYFREPSRQREATYHILYCRLPGWSTDPRRRVKVDILVPPTLELPNITVSEAIRIKGIPVMPVFDLLVMRTHGWCERRKLNRFNMKVKNDVREIFALLELAKEEKVSYVDEADEDRHSQEFMDFARTLASKFVGVYGRHEMWRALQFPLSRAVAHEAALDKTFTDCIVSFLLKR
jgi:hypothetical protein